MCHRPNPTSTGRQYARTLSLILLCSLVPLATAPAQTAPAAAPEASAPAKEAERLQQEVESLRRQLATQRDEATAAAARLTAKLLGLLAYIGLGLVALRLGRTKSIRIGAWLLAQLVLVYVVAVAITRHVIPIAV